jgi:glycosyltransferase involved in cell wall biosynthesis
VAKTNLEFEPDAFAVCVGAYNEPDLLARTLTSIASQDFRPLNVIVSDDAGPTPLGAVVDTFRIRYPDINWVYQRQPVNLGVARNKIWLFSQVSQEFCCFLEHDDTWVSKTFLGDCFRLMRGAPEANLCIGNSEHELVGNDQKRRLMYNNTVPQLQLGQDWQLISGDIVAAAFLRPITTKFLVLDALGSGSANPFNASWSSLSFRTGAVRTSNGLTEESLVPFAEERLLSTYSNEESFGFLYKLLSLGPAFLTLEVISIRGAPATAFSSSIDHPGIGCKNDIEFFNLMSTSRSVSPQNQVIAQLLSKRAMSIGLGMINRHVLAFVGSGPAATRIVVFGRLRYLYIKSLRVFLNTTKKTFRGTIRFVKTGRRQT